ncbi:MAG: hypothetical protein IH600_02120 [Bacteroidetes bacterium]|nr:hypothetical protein [Bacteroidota bacterium]
MNEMHNNAAPKTDIDLSQYYIDAPLAPPAPVALRERTRPVFTGFEDHTITLKEAGSLTRNYRKDAGTGAVKGRYFSRAAIEQLLLQEDVVGIRYYYGKDTDGHPQMVMVAVDPYGQDLTEGFVFGHALPISRFHEEANELNS